VVLLGGGTAWGGLVVVAGPPSLCRGSSIATTFLARKCQNRDAGKDGRIFDPIG
jgi:hypothetical protein